MFSKLRNWILEWYITFQLLEFELLYIIFHLTKKAVKSRKPQQHFLYIGTIFVFFIQAAANSNEIK